MKYLFTILLLCTYVYANDLQLKSQLSEASPGSYVVTEQAKSCALLYIREKVDNLLVIEEISIPFSNFTRQKMSWRQWFEIGAPGHTLWTVSQINLDTGVFEETYSYTHQGWVDMSDSNSFLCQLLNLNFSKIPICERKRVGLPPGVNKKDNRPIWNPRVFIDGVQQTNIPFSAYKARWHRDNSELSCKVINIYLPESNTENYPTFFPYLVEVEGKVANVKLRIIDAGIEARSARQPFSLKAPELNEEPFWSEEGLTFKMKINNSAYST